MTLEELRARIDGIDAELIRLFAERMDVSAEIAAYKREHGMPVLDAAREREKLRRAAALLAGELQRAPDLRHGPVREHGPGAPQQYPHRQAGEEIAHIFCKRADRQFHSRAPSKT